MHSVEGTFTTCININAPDQSSSCHIFLECWWRKLAKNQRSLPAFFLGPKAHVHDPVHVLLVGLNHMHGPTQNFLVCFGAPKLYAFPICKCYAFLNILLGYPLCLTTTHKHIHMYTNWSPKRQQKPAAMAEPVDPEATTNDSSESKETILPEDPAMPKARESTKLEPD